MPLAPVVHSPVSVSRRHLIAAAGLASLASLGIVGDQGGAPSRTHHASPPIDISDEAEAVREAVRNLPPLPVRIFAPETASVSGWVIDTSGEPIAGVEVTWADPAGDEPLVAYTAADGSFRLGDRATQVGNLTLRGPGVFEAEVPWQGGDKTSRVMATRRMSVYARVTAGGEPVAGAEVALSDGSGDGADAAVTDADGLVAFEDLMPGVYELWAHDGARVSALARAARFDAGPFDNVELVLDAGTTVSGRVVDALGAGLDSAITLVPVDVDHAVRHATTDASGTFTVGALPRGKWRVEASAAGYIAGRDYVVHADGASASIDVALRRAGVVVGRVIDADGLPVAGAVLALHDQSNNKVVSASAQAPAATFGGIRWIHPLAGKRRLPIYGQRFGAHRPGVRAAECGRGHCGVDMGQERGATIHAAADGTVIVAARKSQGISGRFIAIEHSGGLRSLYIHLDELRSDIEVGQRVRAGEPIGTMGRTGFAIGRAHLHFAITQRIDGRRWYVDPEPMLRQAVVLPEAGSLEGHLNAAATGASPTLVATREASATRVASPTITRVVSDTDGRFRIEGVAPSTYVVTAYHADLAPGRSAALRVTYGSTLSDVSVRMAPGVVVHGTVLGPTRAIAGARVIAIEGEGESERTVAQSVTDANGQFELRALSGSVTVAAVAQGYGRAQIAVALGAGALRAERKVDFDLVAADATLRALVVDAQGFPVAGAGVEILSGPTARGRKSVTDAQGYFAYEQLAPGTYRVEVESKDFPTATAEVTTGDGGKVSMPPGGGLSIYVRDVHSRAPLAEVRIVATGPGGARTTVTTSADGLCELVPLAAGTWTLSADVAGYVAFRRTVTVVAGTGARAITGEPTIELARGATVGGVVYDSAGERVAGATVKVGSASTTTDQDGYFRLRDAPTGSIEIVAEADDHRGQLSLELAPGDELVTLDVQLGD